VPWPPQEPAPSPWDFDLTEVDPGEDLVGVGGDLAPGTLLAAYRSGVFPMGLGEDGARPMGWWSPDPRGVLLPGRISVSRSLRKSCRRFEFRVDHAFDEVVERCGYSDVPSFRKLFKRETSLTPADYRERFRLRAR